MYIFNILSAVIFAAGLFFLLCDLFRVPTYLTSRTMRGMERLYKDKEKSRINSTLDDFARWLSTKIRLRDFKKAQIQANLATARMDMTAEMFVATCIVKALVVASLSILVFPMFTFGGFAILLFAFVYYLSLLEELGRKVNKHREALEFELVRMIFTIERTLLRDRNVLVMLQNYRELAGPEMAQELDITLADMNSGNHEQAISRMEIRVGSIMMSDVCRGLISIIRGDDTTAYWVNLQQKFAEHQRSILRAKAEKVPQRVSRLSMVLLFAFMALWLTALILQMVDAFAELFQAL